MQNVKNDPMRYTNVAIALHWITALLLIYMLFWGEELIMAPRGSVPTNPMLHASLGISILILGAVRLAWRLMNPPPPDVPMPKWQRVASTIVHGLFYAALFLIPLSGMALLDSEIAGRHPELANLTYFGLFSIPHYTLPWFGGTHEAMTKIAIGLLIIHVGAALKHQFWDKDKLLKRMTPH